MNAEHKVIGSYRLESKLGEGGMGVIYRAVHTTLDRTVALKVLPDRLVKNNQPFVERFHQEARAAAKIDHPNIVRVYDAGEVQGTYFIAMEFVQGTDFRKLVDRKGRIPEKDVIAAAIQACSGLMEAAKHKIIHRDIKPANLMIDDRGTVKVADFGLAKNVDAMSNLTRSGQVMGTPAYMSPEQADGARTDFRSDIYSLGVTLFELCTGQRPYVSESSLGLLQMHCEAPVPDPRERNSSLAALPPVIMKMMSKSPSQRHQSYEELLAELKSASEKLPSGMERTPVPPDAPDAPMPYTLYVPIEEAWKDEKPESPQGERVEKPSESTARRRRIMEFNDYAFSMPNPAERAGTPPVPPISPPPAAAKQSETARRARPPAQSQAGQAPSSETVHTPPAGRTPGRSKPSSTRTGVSPASASGLPPWTAWAGIGVLAACLLAAGIVIAAGLLKGGESKATGGISRESGDESPRLATEADLLSARESTARMRDYARDAGMKERHDTEAAIRMWDKALNEASLEEDKSLIKARISDLSEIKSMMENLDRAGKALSSGLVDVAEGLYTKVLKSSPGNVEATLGLKQVARQREQANYEMAMARGRLAEKQSNLEAAAEAYRKALEYGKGDIEATAALARVMSVLCGLPRSSWGILIAADGDVDSRGNPVVVRDKSRRDPATNRPYEIWLRNPRMELVLILPGTFSMGSPDSETGHEPTEEPVHEVKATDAFYIGKYEVTQAQWKSVMGENPSEALGDDKPVEQVTWNRTQDFFEKLSKMSLDFAFAGLTFRLPSEAEWEYACRAGSRTPFCAVLKDGDMSGLGWSAENASGGSHEVGKKAPNAWGLYDMHGNVCEWCRDFWHNDYWEAPADAKPRLTSPSGTIRVLRGGSWHVYAGDCRSASRAWMKQNAYNGKAGFRVALELR